MKWISVKEKLPDNEDDVLVYDQSLQRMTVSCYYSHLSYDPNVSCSVKSYSWEQRYDQIFFENITHWMPLPEPPAFFV